MAKHFLIGIGGTGSKCVESFTYLSACGLGPENLWVGLIDMDKSNGNLKRSIEILHRYSEFYLALQNENNIGDCNFFGTNISLSSTEEYWCPLDDTDIRFGEFFNYSTMDESEKRLVSCLYSQEEIQQNLSVGFRGRPSLGAPIFLSQADNPSEDDDSDFWKELLDAGLKAAKENEDIHVFVIGSIFGGTGAAGIPNIAKVIRDAFKEENVENKLTIGAALLLPYFNYPDEKTSEITARPENFLQNTRGTLHYYAKIQKTGLFDSLHLHGWDIPIELDDFNIGDEAQQNPALFPEMLAALSAARFFSFDKTRKYSAITTRDGDRERIGWSDIPSINDQGFAFLKQRLGRLTRFCFAYLVAYEPYLNINGSETKLRDLKAVSKQRWFYQLFTKLGVDVRKDKTNDFFSSLESFCVKYLEWIANISWSVGGADLFEVQSFSKKPNGKIGNHSILIDPTNFKVDEFSEIVRGTKGRDLAEVYKMMNLFELKDEKLRDVGAFCRALYECCSID